MTKDVADYALVAGVPARQTGWVDESGTVKKGLTEDKQNERIIR